MKKYEITEIMHETSESTIKDNIIENTTTNPNTTTNISEIIQ